MKAEPDLVSVRDRHLVTSAGVTAGIDMALAPVEEDHGPEAARDVARQLGGLHGTPRRSAPVQRP